MFKVKSKLHDAKSGICIVAHVGENFNPLVFSDNLIFALDKCRWVLFSNLGKSSHYFITTKFIKLLDCFSTINSQSTKSRSYFLGIDGRTILTIFFSTLTKFRKSTKLSNKCDTIYYYSVSTILFQFKNEKKWS
jgi:hypothetical protein